jgi:hypothetical protein
MFFSDILETSHSPSFFQISFKNWFFPSTTDKTNRPYFPWIPYFILSPDEGRRTTFHNYMVWKSGMMDNIKNITQKHIYNSGSLYSINILDQDDDYYYYYY